MLLDMTNQAFRYGRSFITTISVHGGAGGCGFKLQMCLEFGPVGNET